MHDEKNEINAHKYSDRIYRIIGIPFAFPEERQKAFSLSEGKAPPPSTAQKTEEEYENERRQRRIEEFRRRWIEFSPLYPEGAKARRGSKKLC
jgi:hypothetical protein